MRAEGAGCGPVFAFFLDGMTGEEERATDKERATEEERKELAPGEDERNSECEWFFRNETSGEDERREWATGEVERSSE